MNNEKKSIEFPAARWWRCVTCRKLSLRARRRIVIAENCVVTPSARDFLQQRNVALETNGTGGRPQPRHRPPLLSRRQFRAGPRRAQSAPLQHAGSRSHQEGDLRGGQEALDAPVR